MIFKSNFEDDPVFKTCGELENVPICDEFEEKFRVDNEDGRLVNMIKESFLMARQEIKEAQEEQNGVGALPKPK